MGRTATVFMILVFLAGPATGEQEPFLGYEGQVYGNGALSTGHLAWAGMVEGDFNEDGIADFATFDDDFTRVMIGNGDWTFTAVSVPGTPWNSGDGKIADFNEDGHQDLATVNSGNDLVVNLGNGDGTFGAPTSFPAPYLQGNWCWPIAVGDFDEDGHEDVIMGWIHNQVGLAFFSGNGDGTFAAPTLVGAGSGFDIVVADFNQDNHLDFIVGSSSFGNGMARVWLGTGTGTFTDGGSYDIGVDTWDYVVIDFNGDTHLDFATANKDSDDISVHLGNGDGTFGAETTYAVDPEPQYLAAGDVDSDGNADIVVSRRWFTNLGSYPYLSLLTGNGDGTFDPEVRIPTVLRTGPITLSDLDDDGYLDVVVAGYFDPFFVMRGLGDGTFDWAKNIVISEGPASTASGVAAVLNDMDNDGLHDAVNVLDDGSVTVMLANGDGSFSVSGTAALSGLIPRRVAVADVNNDTNLDVIMTTAYPDAFAPCPPCTGPIAVLTGNGDGTLDPPTLGQLLEAEGIATGLFDADANVDLAAATTSAGPQIEIMLGDGNGTFTFDGAYGVGQDPYSVATADFNEDNKMDLLVVVYDSVTFLVEASVLLAVGDGTFQTEVRYPGCVGLLDVNEDGHQDLVCSDGTARYGVGDGTFGVITPIDSGVSPFAVADANGDGRNDHFAGALEGLQLVLRQEDGGFAAAQTSVWQAGGTSIVEDANGDGRNDVITARTSGVTVTLNVEPTPFNFAADKATMNWPVVTGALSYNVYRGLISSLVDGDSDGLPDAGYGNCQNALDPDTSDQHYFDADIPPSGDGYFYLIAAVDWAGERYLGKTSAGLARVPGTACP